MRFQRNQNNSVGSEVSFCTIAILWAFNATGNPSTVRGFLMCCWTKTNSHDPKFHTLHPHPSLPALCGKISFFYEELENCPWPAGQLRLGNKYCPEHLRELPLPIFRMVPWNLFPVTWQVIDSNGAVPPQGWSGNQPGLHAQRKAELLVQFIWMYPWKSSSLQGQTSRE